MKPPIFTNGNAAFKKALNSVVEFARVHGINPGGIPGWSQSADGWRPPAIPPSVTAVPLLWELTVEDADLAQVSIKCAKILKDASNLFETLAIQNEEEVFSVGNGDKIFLKITTTFINSQFVTEVSLEKDGTWEDYPARYEITNSGDDAQFTAYYYPLYYFDDISDDDSITIISEELYAHRVCENSHFELIWAIYQKGTDAALTVPKLVASHAPLPPS